MSFLSALAAGYTQDQVLNFLVSSFPNLGRKIRQAKQMGHDVESILKMFNGVDKKRLKKLDEEAKRSPEVGYNPWISGQEATYQSSGQEDVKRLGKTALGVGATALGAYGAARFAPAVATALSGALQGFQPSKVGPTPMSNAPTSNPPQIPLSPQPPNASLPTQPQLGTVEAPNIVSPTSSLPPSESVNIIKQMGLEPQIKSLQQAGNSPEAIAAGIGVSLRPAQKKWLDDQIKIGKAKPLVDMIQDVIAQPQTPSTSQFVEQPMQQTEVEPQKLEKGHLAATADGKIGEVKSLRNGNALIEENGKLHQVKATDLESLTNKYKDVHFDISKIPESERSSALYGVSSNRNKTELTIEYFPRNENSPDEEYEYFRKDGKPFDEDLINRLREGLDIPVSSGFEWGGYWNAEKGDSRGSTNHHEIKMQAQDISKVESGEEPNDPSKPLFFYKKKKIFGHGFAKLARREFGKHAQSFRKEYKEMTGVKKRKKRNP